MLVIALMASPAVNANGGKKKAKKKAKIECSKDKCCDMKSCQKDAKCPPMPLCTGNK